MAVVSVDDQELTVETRSVSPAHFLMKIGSFSLLSKNRSSKLKSKEFSAGGYRWRLVICLDGDGVGDEDQHLSVYVATTDAESSSGPGGWEVNAIFSIFLYNQILDNYLCYRGKMGRFNAMKSIWGFSKLISMKSLKEPSNGLIVDDTCILGAEIFVIQNQLSVECLSLFKYEPPLKDESQKKHSWTFANFSKLKNVCSTEEFTAGCYKWYVELYPNGNGNQGKHVSIFLHCVDISSHGAVQADMSICLKNQLSKEHLSYSTSHKFTTSETDWGWPSFVPIEDMRNPEKGFVVNDCCIIETEVTVEEAPADERDVPLCPPEAGACILRSSTDLIVHS